MTERQPRGLAIAALREWRTTDRFADAILHRLLQTCALAGPDRAFTTELFYGVLRNLTLLDHWIGSLRDSKTDNSARDLLRLGLYQLLILKSAEHASVFETVALAKPHARGLVNAILRAAQNRRNALLASVEDAPLATRFSHPSFLVERWRKQFGDDNAVALCAWNNQPPQTYARVNQLNISIAEFLAKYPVVGSLMADFHTMVHTREFPTDALERGDCYVQDPSTTIACTLLDPQPGETVLDACAAPGGKTAFLAELMQNRGRIVATDREVSRLATVRENMQRLGVKIAELQQRDWTADLPTDVQSFDRILVDAPCSNTGVMRRRVDVRWRLTPTDFARMRAEQIAIVTRILPLLKSNGVLVYSTCSIERDENESVVDELQRTFPTLRLAEQKSSLPFRDAVDGAFAARFVAS